MTRPTPKEQRVAVSRSARVYSLGGSLASEAWVVIHGYGQLAARFLTSLETLAAPDRLVVAPEGLSRFYLEAGAGRVGASWMTKEDRAREIEEYLAYLEAMRAALVPKVPLTILGFSQGVATASRWAVATRPAPIRVVCWGGLVPEEIPATALDGIRLTFVVGEREEWAPFPDVEEQAARFRAAGVSVEVIRFDGGHEIRPEVVVKLIRS